MWVYIWNDTWLPNKNTIAYFPFVDDTLDHSWNWVTLSITWTKANIWYSFSTTSSWNSVEITSEDAKFINFRINIQSLNTYYSLAWYVVGWYIYYYKKHQTSSLNERFWIFAGSGGSQPITSNQISISNWTWYNICLWYDNNWSYWYLNWELVFSTSSLPYNWDSTVWVFSTRGWSWSWTAIISNFIVESKQWTQSEISNYYNQTKSQYWIS